MQTCDYKTTYFWLIGAAEQAPFVSGQELMSSVSVLEPSDDLGIPNEAVGSFGSTCSVDWFKYILFTSRVLRSHETFGIVLPSFLTKIQTKGREILQLLYGKSFSQFYHFFWSIQFCSSTLTFYPYFRLKNRKTDFFFYFAHLAD